jgi:hypothetical protein
MACRSADLGGETCPSLSPHGTTLRIGSHRSGAGRTFVPSAAADPFAILSGGEVSEWLMVPLSKSGVRKHRGFESRPLRQDSSKRPAGKCAGRLCFGGSTAVERSPSGLWRRTGNAVRGNPSRVRIPPSPPTTRHVIPGSDGLMPSAHQIPMSERGPQPYSRARPPDDLTADARRCAIDAAPASTSDRCAQDDNGRSANVEAMAPETGRQDAPDRLDRAVLGGELAVP